MKRIRVGLIFGGRSVEHEVSLVSARAVLDHLDRDRYEVVPIGVTRHGRWLTAADARVLLEEGLARSAGRRAALTGDPSVGGLVPIGDGGVPVTLDVIFPLIHGTGGEDGTLQGLLELAGLPYVGSGVLGSSLGMDKAAMKMIFAAAGIPCAAHVTVTKRSIADDAAAVQRDVSREIGYPCFVKPSNGGSSVGVSKVKGAESLPAALALAAAYDRRVIVEEAIEGQEVECSVLGNESPEASVVGEIVPCHEFYDYDAKYIDDGSELDHPGADFGEAVRPGSCSRGGGVQGPRLRRNGARGFLREEERRRGAAQRGEHDPRVHADKHVPATVGGERGGLRRPRGSAHRSGDRAARAGRRAEAGLRSPAENPRWGMRRGRATVTRDRR